MVMRTSINSKNVCLNNDKLGEIGARMGLFAHYDITYGSSPNLNWIVSSQLRLSYLKGLTITNFRS